MAKKQNKSTDRSRHFTLVLYCSLNALQIILLNNLDCIANYAYILHDKDIYDDDVKEGEEILHKKGDLKKAHIHMVISFYNVQRWSTVCKMFSTEEDNARVEVCNSRVAQYRYLTHADNPERYQYPKSSIVSNDINFYEKVQIHGDKKDVDNVAEKIIDDMLACVSPYLLCKRYGRDFIIHYRQYKDVVDAIRDYSSAHPKARMQTRQAIPLIEDDEENPFE